MKENLRILKVLMWKHMVVRRRKYICTFFELFSPILLLVIIYFIQDKFIGPGMESAEAEKTKRAALREVVEPVVDLKSFIEPDRIFYTPDNNLTSSLMALVAKNLNLKRLKKFPGPTHRGYLAIANASELTPYYDSLTDNDALVIFDDMAKGVLPERLKYTIRIKDRRFHTETYEPEHVDQLVSLGVEEPKRRHASFGDVYITFLRLQWAVDSSFLQMKTGNVVDKKILLREMPYRNQDKINILKAVITLLATIVAMLGIQITFVVTVMRTSSERNSGVQEIMKTSGASTILIYLSHCLNSLILGILYAFAMTIFMSVIGQPPIVSDFSPFFLFVMFVLYALSIIAFGLAVGGFIPNANYTISISSILYSITCLATLVTNVSTKTGLKNQFLVFLLGVIMPHLPMARFFRISMVFEDGIGLTEPVSTSGSVLLVYICLIGQTLLYFFIAWYLYNVHPGKYGVAMPLNFFFMKEYWRRQKVKPEELMELQETRKEERDPRYFEPIQADQQVGIKVVNLSKIYKSLGKAPVTALRDVNIDVCKDGITVLLGHNGAGKTTLIDIITGMRSATTGEVYVNGHHFKWERTAIHKQLGYCPQHNLLFSDLDVLQHFVFFSMIRGNSRTNAYLDARKVIVDLNLTQRAKAVPSQLSGGMSRRVQIGCALVGKTSVLVLDEPTSSLDVQSRRQLWDVLLALRGSCTILVSTHFLEEADALGARVCALRRGTLTCDASPLHLKRSIGEGYYLTIGGGNEGVASTIMSVIPTANIYRSTPTSVTYTLPNSETSNLPKLFTQLEKRRTELGILSMGVSAPTLDEVFLKLCYDGTVTDSYDQVDRRNFFGTSRKLTGQKLWRQQFTALFKRYLRYLRQHLFCTILFIILPLAAMIAVVLGSNVEASKSGKNTTRSFENLNPARSMSLHIYEALPFVKVMYNFDANYAQALEYLKADNVKFVRSHNVHEDAYRQLKEDESNYERNLIGIELNDTTAQVLYSKTYRHLAPVALNLLTNVIAQQTVPNKTNPSLRTVTTFNYPIMTAKDRYMNDPYMFDMDHYLRTSNGSVVTKQMIGTEEVAWYLGILVVCLLYNSTTLLKEEYKSGARSNYLRAGVSSTMYWSATLVIHMLIFIVIYLPVYLLPLAICDINQTLNTKEYLLTMTLILILSATSTLAVQYALHVLFTPTAIIMYVIYAFAYLIIILPLITYEEMSSYSTGASMSETLAYVAYPGYIFPFAHIGRAITHSSYIAQLNAYCRINRGQCPNLRNSGDTGFNSQDCCDSKDEYLSYFGSFFMSPTNDLIILFFMTIIYMVLTVLGQNGVFTRLVGKMWASRYTARPLPPDDGYVAAEREYVAKQITKAKRNVEDNDDALLMHDVHKMYPLVCKKDIIALEGINLSVRKGECFGILGVNGAGKTTAFKVIVGEEYPTRGELYVNGYSLTDQRSKYLNSVAYCQQYGGVDSFLTGRQCLETLLTVSGYSKDLVKSETKAWLECVDMTSYADKKVGSYSGGCARRLAAAAALCGARPLVLLDEPSSGVDTHARQKLWRAVNSSLGYSAVVLTSHSLDEMEALCARMALVRNGRVGALGDAHALRHAHAHGHALLLHLTHGPYETTRTDLVNRLKEDIRSNFDCTLKQEIVNQLVYHINVTMSYSEIFTKLEALKVKHAAILDDYCVNETTLEEVFLTFAAGQDIGRKKDV